jgi:hypothetical protein
MFLMSNSPGILRSVWDYFTSWTLASRRTPFSHRLFSLPLAFSRRPLNSSRHPQRFRCRHRRDPASNREIRRRGSHTYRFKRRRSRVACSSRGLRPIVDCRRVVGLGCAQHRASHRGGRGRGRPGARRGGARRRRECSRSGRTRCRRGRGGARPGRRRCGGCRRSRTGHPRTWYGHFLVGIW